MSVRFTPSDFDKLQRAAQRLWPGATLTEGGIVRDLACKAAADALATIRNGKKSR